MKRYSSKRRKSVFYMEISSQRHAVKGYYVNTECEMDVEEDLVATIDELH